MEDTTITWLRSSSISLNGYGSKIRKVGTCRPTVSNEAILATRQEFFFTKVAPVQSITEINAALLNVYFILHHHLFFVKKYIFPNVYISVNTIFKCFYMLFGWERDHQVSTYATYEGMGESRLHLRTWGVGRGCHASCVRTHLHYLFSCFWQHFCLIMSCF